MYEELNKVQLSLELTRETKSRNRDYILHKINEIFASNSHIIKSRVKITFKDDIVERTIIGKTGTSLLTLSGDKIPIADILDIEKV